VKIAVSVASVLLLTEATMTQVRERPQSEGGGYPPLEVQ
jgi:hypothetical protein